MIHEALAETYVPLLNVLYDLKHDGTHPRLTIGLTPVLLEQMADRRVLEHFEVYLQEEIEVARSDVRRFDREGRPDLRRLAESYGEWYRDVLSSFEQRYSRNVVGAFRQLQDDGNVDILTSAATHAYLPLLERDSTVYAQLKIGLETSRRHLNRAPHGIWLPECGYRPARYGDASRGRYRPGIEEFLADLNLRYFVADTHVIHGGEMLGKVVGDAHGPYAGLAQRRLVVQPEERAGDDERTTFRPYYVRASRVAAFGRDARTGLQVWSAHHGYPGDPVYREFHRKDPISGLRYWRVTAPDVDLGAKEAYDPSLARRRVVEHADHFARLVEDLLSGYHRAHGRPGLVVSAYDAELFGHWWFEGVLWLREVLRRLARHPDVGLVTTDEYLEMYPPDEALTLGESSWGVGGGHWTWRNPETEWMWPSIHSAELRMEQLVERYPSAEGWLRDVLNQAARELLLLTASDWPFLVSAARAPEYASSRFQQHLARFNYLAGLADSGRLTGEGERFLATVAEADNLFPTIDYGVFARQERD